MRLLYWDPDYLGQAASFVWQEIQAQSGSFALTAGQEYAVLASVSKNYSLSDVENYLTSHGYQVLYGWEYGTPTRSPPGSMDQWLASLPADTTDNHRWIYGEVIPSAATSIGQSAPWPLTVYSIAHAFVAVAAPPQQQQQTQQSSVLPPPQATPGGVTPGQAAQAASNQPALLTTPATTVAAPAAPFPWAPFAAGAVVGGLLTVGGYFVREWLIHR
jgi:hypothetical protein